jgi:hypothetical protein
LLPLHEPRNQRSIGKARPNSIPCEPSARPPVNKPSKEVTFFSQLAQSKGETYLPARRFPIAAVRFFERRNRAVAAKQRPDEARAPAEPPILSAVKRPGLEPRA